MLTICFVWRCRIHGHDDSINPCLPHFPLDFARTPLHALIFIILFNFQYMGTSSWKGTETYSTWMAKLYFFSLFVEMSVSSNLLDFTQECRKLINENRLLTENFVVEYFFTVKCRWWHSAEVKARPHGSSGTIFGGKGEDLMKVPLIITNYQFVPFLSNWCNIEQHGIWIEIYWEKRCCHNHYGRIIKIYGLPKRCIVLPPIFPQ